MTHHQNSYLRQTKPEAQRLYDHLLYHVRHESPDKLIERFSCLFIDGLDCDYIDADVQDALKVLVHGKEAREEFKYILNRCCHIIINHWQMRSQLQAAIPNLVDLLCSQSTLSPGHSRHTQKLRFLIRDFTTTEQYLTLQRLAKVIEQQTAAINQGSQPVGVLISRYPYLYEHCLLSEDSSYEHQQTVRQVQSEVQKRFEVDLSRYVTYQVRLAKVARQRQLNKNSRRVIIPVDNPTLLAEKELACSLKHFIGRSQGNKTYYDLAQSFITHTQRIPSYRSFKNELYEYLTYGIDSSYSNRNFNERLHQQLKITLPDREEQMSSEFLVMRTASKLLNFLVVESRQHPQHYVFVDLITNLGVTQTVGLLLKIVLLCRKVKPYLEKRFSILFSHYETDSKDVVPWLVKSLENLNLAFSIHFGNADLSCLKYIM